jgi:hypothetical protein
LAGVFGRGALFNRAGLLSDIGGHWAEKEIKAWTSRELAGGYPDGSFQPTKAITRAEALSVLDRAVGTLYSRAGTYGPFQGTVVLEGNPVTST